MLGSLRLSDGGGEGREKDVCRAKLFLPDTLTPGCNCVLSPWKPGELRVALHSSCRPVAGAWNMAPSCCIVSHGGREQPPLLRVRGSCAGLLHFLCVVGIRRRLATSAALCCQWFCWGFRGRAHLRESVNAPC